MPVNFPILEFQLSTDLANVYKPTHPSGRLCGLSRLNVFIGPNNAGKSRFLRALFTERKLPFVANTPDARELRLHLEELREQDITEAGMSDKLVKFFQRCTVPLQMSDGTRVAEQERKNITTFANQFVGQYRSLQAILPRSGMTIRDALVKAAKLSDRLYGEPSEKLSPHYIYIPSLRGLRPPEGDRLYFRARTFNDYFKGKESLSDALATEDIRLMKTPIVTGLELYDELQTHLLGTLQERELIKGFQEFLSKWFFEGVPVALIPRKGASLHVKIGDEQEQPIHNLGDGIQQVIILCVPIFLHQDKTLLLFVEEPELFIHPGYQRIWIDLILNSPSVLQVFVATHSHQFMDITVDSEQCSVFKFKGSLEPGDTRERLKQYEINGQASRDFSVLRELGVRNSSVMLSNCTIWVEGITDRLYLKHYLALYQALLETQAVEREEQFSPFVEDLHFSFVEYGGSAITHFSFLDTESGIKVERLCGELLLFADSDSDRKKERHEVLEKALGERFIRLPCREVENLLTPQVIKQVIESYEGKATLKEFAIEDYRREPLGRFIQQHVIEGESVRRSKDDNPYAAASGTIKDKVTFCQKAINVMTAWDSTSPDAQQIAKNIYSFVSERNPKPLSS